jgi:chromosome segregation ATPase
MGAGGSDGFLPLAEAAARLGVSRLKLRDAIARGLIPARRDNEGRWRADMTAALVDMTAGSPAAPEALIEALFDEIEELTAERAEAEADRDRLADLLAAQADALERALAAAEAKAGDAARLRAVTDGALAAAETAAARAEALQATADRALALADRAGSALAAAQADNARLQDGLSEKTAALDGQARLLDRLFSLSETALETAGRASGPRGLWDRVLGRK